MAREAPKVSLETVGRLADEVVGVPVAAKDRKAVLDLLQAFFAEMGPMRGLEVGEDEPATVYTPEVNS